MDIHSFFVGLALREAWRDFVWRDGGGPSSILLMETVVRIFDAIICF